MATVNQDVLAEEYGNGVLDNIKNFILYSLGYPVVRVEVTDAILTTAIVDGIDKFFKYAAFDFNLRAVPTGGQTQIDIPSDIDPEDIFDVVFDNDTIGVATGGAITQALRVGGVNFVVPYEKSILDNFQITQYYMYLQQLEDIKRIFGIDKHWEIVNRKIFIFPNSIQDQNIGILYSAKTPMEVIDQEDWIRDYALAKTKTVLGHIRTKFSGMALPGGGITFDGTSLISEGTEEMKELMTILKTERRRPLPIVQI